MADIKFDYWYFIATLETSYYPGNDIKLHLMVRLQSWSLGNEEYFFIMITFLFTLTRSARTCLGLIVIFSYAVS